MKKRKNEKERKSYIVINYVFITKLAYEWIFLKVSFIKDKNKYILHI